jgi:hypothetical protein
MLLESRAFSFDWMISTPVTHAAVVNDDATPSIALPETIRMQSAEPAFVQPHLQNDSKSWEKKR